MISRQGNVEKRDEKLQELKTELENTRKSRDEQEKSSQARVDGLAGELKGVCL